MGHFPRNLQQKLDKRGASNALRQLGVQNQLVDFASNDYLGFARSKSIFEKTHAYLRDHGIYHNGSSGSRLLSGNHVLYPILETMLCEFHHAESALVFNSGYDANLGFFSSVAQRGDIILYDEYIHASIRDGMGMSHAKSFKFKHNDLEDLGRHLERGQKLIKNNTLYVVTESVFSMDGDSPDLENLVELCDAHKAYLIIDEAHAIGVFGEKGEGMVQDLGLEKSIFARLVTFGKALGGHGAAILGAEVLKQYLVNFSRSFIYTTALPPHSLATVQLAYHELVNPTRHNDDKNDRRTHPAGLKLKENIQFFKSEVKRLGLQTFSWEDRPKTPWGFIESNSAIHCYLVPGSNNTKIIAKALQEKGYDVRPILSPTVPEGQERLRFCLHAFNSKEEITEVLKLLATFVF